MTTINPPDDTSADAILIAFADAGPAADLADWTRRHPEHARLLARFAAERHYEAQTGFSPGVAVADARVRDIGRAVLASLRPTLMPSPLTSLVLAAKARGLSADAVADALDLPVACFWKLHRRLFAPDSVPRTLVAALAAALARTESEVAAYLRQPPTLARGASYKAASAPAVGVQEEFAPALARDPDLTNTARARWLRAPNDAG